MKFLNKIKNYAFWVGLSSAIVVFLDEISNAFNINIPSSSVEKIILAFCGILVVLGFVSKDKTNNNSVILDSEDDLNNKKE